MSLINSLRFTLVLTLFLLCCSTRSPDWLVYYGSDLKSSQLNSVEIAIVDPDHVDPKQFSEVKTRFIAYVSVGEAESYRSYWNLIKSEPNLFIEKNPNWPDNHLVDIRNTRWQSLILDTLIPRYIQKGFDGIFLDTIDVAIEMERRDAQRFSRSADELVNLIFQIRKRFPEITLLPNNGLHILPRIQDVIDGVVVEDLYTRYNFQSKRSEATPALDSNPKQSKLLAFAQQTQKPVYVILYDQSPDSELIQSAKRRCEQNHFKWFVATVDLQSIQEQN